MVATDRGFEEPIEISGMVNMFGYGRAGDTRYYGRRWKVR